MTDLKLPYSTEAEKALLGSLIIDQNSLARIYDLLQPDDFYHSAHGMIYRTLVKLSATGLDYDLVSIVADLEENKILKKIGGAAYISELASEVHTSTHIVNHSKIIKEKSLRRASIKAVHDLSLQVMDEKVDIKVGIQNILSRFGEVLQDKKIEESGVRAVLNKLIESWEDIQKTGLGLPIGVPELEKVIKGYRPGHYWVIMAYTSWGKTAFSIMLLDKLLASSPKECVVFFSSEMTQLELAGKLLAQRTGEEVYTIQKDMEGEKFIRALSELDEKKLFIFDDCLTTQKIKLKLNFLRMKGYNPKVIFVDYIQNLRGRGKNEYERMTDITTELQSISIRDKICVVALSQVPDDAAAGSPILIKGKGTGAIGATAGLVMQLIRDKEQEAASGDVKVPVEVLVTKNRYGPTGRFEVWHDKSTGLYQNQLADTRNLKIASMEKQKLY